MAGQVHVRVKEVAARCTPECLHRHIKEVAARVHVKESAARLVQQGKRLRATCNTTASQCRDTRSIYVTPYKTSQWEHESSHGVVQWPLDGARGTRSKYLTPFNTIKNIGRTTQVKQRQREELLKRAHGILGQCI